MGKIFSGLIIFVHVQPLIPLILFLENRYSRRYWLGRFLHPEVYDSVAVTVLYGLNDIIYSFSAIFSAVLAIGIPVIFINITVVFLLRLRQIVQSLPQGKKGTALVAFVPIKKIYMMYREIQIFSTIGVKGFGSVAIPLLIFFSTIVTVLMVTCLIQSFRILHPIILFNFLVGSCFMLAGFHLLIEAGGKVLDISRDIKFSVLHRFRFLARKSDRYSLQACQEIRIYVASFLYFHSATFILYCKFALELIINFLFMIDG